MYVYFSCLRHLSFFAPLRTCAFFILDHFSENFANSDKTNKQNKISSTNVYLLCVNDWQYWVKRHVLFIGYPGWSIDIDFHWIMEILVLVRNSYLISTILAFYWRSFFQLTKICTYDLMFMQEKSSECNNSLKNVTKYSKALRMATLQSAVHAKWR